MRVVGRTGTPESHLNLVCASQASPMPFLPSRSRAKCAAAGDGLGCQGGYLYPTAPGHEGPSNRRACHWHVQPLVLLRISSQSRLFAFECRHGAGGQSEVFLSLSGRTGIADGTCTSTGARCPSSVLTPAVPVFSAVCHQAQPLHHRPRGRCCGSRVFLWGDRRELVSTAVNAYMCVYIYIYTRIYTRHETVSLA